METLHPIQNKILSTLIFKPNARFKELNTDSLTSDSFSYHIKNLIAQDLINKDGSYYSLTSKGKMLAGKLDTVTHKLEKQPKVSVIVIPHAVIDGEQQFIIQQRTKEPYFGYWGFIAGKIRFGETVIECAQREMQEELGITGSLKFCYEIHEMVYDKASGDQLEDKFFHIVEAVDLKGEVLKQTIEGVNKFVTVSEFLNITPKYHNEDDLLNWFLKKDFSFKEEKYYIDKF